MRNRRQAGYSLAELLTVVAIIGALALVTVPAFMNFYQSNKMKSSMRTFMSDLRGMRQLSIAQGKQTLLTYGTGANKRTYDLYLGDRNFGSTNWSKTSADLPFSMRATRRLDDVVYFPAHVTGTTPQTFTDVVDCSAAPCVAGTDTRIDVIFFPDGRVSLPSGLTTATISIMTDLKIPTPLYQVTVSPSGRVQAN